MTQAVAVAAATGAGAGLLVGLAVWMLELRPGRYRRADDTPRLELASTWWTLPAFTVAGGIAGLAHDWWVLPAWVYLIGGVILVWTDLDVHRIPNRILILLIPILLGATLAAASLSGEWPRLLGGLWGALALGGAYLVLAVVGSMGLGDVKLSVLTGGLLGVLNWPTAVWFGGLAGLAAGAIAAMLLLARGHDSKTHMPLGPAIIVGAAAAIIRGALG